MLDRTQSEAAPGKPGAFAIWGNSESGIQESDDYDIYYWGYDLDNASGILFDPKGDAKILKVGSGWEKIEGREAVETVVKWVDFPDFNYTPELYRVLGPDDALFGYLFTGWYHVP